MPKKTLIPIQYPPSPRRHPYPPPPPRTHNHTQPPPSNAAAKAAHAAKVLHRRALDRAAQKQHWDETKEPRRPAEGVFRRTEDDSRYHRRDYYENVANKDHPPPGYPYYYNYPYPPHVAQQPPPPAYDEENGNAAGNTAHSQQAPPPVLHRSPDYLRYEPDRQFPHPATHPHVPPEGYYYPPYGVGVDKKEDVKYHHHHHPPHESTQPQRSTRRVLGGHTPIHVPRADDPDVLGQQHQPHPRLSSPPDMPDMDGRMSVFRSSKPPSQGSNAMAAKERKAHEILLSLSKSFEKKEDCGNDNKERPKSPEEPPRLKHFHKEGGDGFEPQPSPLRPEKPETDIDFAPSFTLFNQSFDMNLENLLGPNASFGLGPMKSLSFGLGGGFGGSIDYAEAPSPISIRRTSDKKEEGVMILGDSVRVASPSALEKKRDREEKNIVLDGNARNLPFRLRDDEEKKMGDDDGPLDVLVPPPSKKKKVMKHSSSSMDLASFKIIEAHSSVFRAFTYLLPGAKMALSKKGDNSAPEEIARRRINSALCAFGGSALQKTSSKKTAFQRQYEQMLPDRYYEDNNRLSWEVEEDPPVEISDEENSITSKNKLSLSDSTDYSALSLQRNMGVMIYPAINAFVAAEPGIITPALSEMNNFVSGKSPECTPAKGATMTLPPVTKSHKKLPMVSPDNVKLGPESSDKKNASANLAGGAWISNCNAKTHSISKKEMAVPDHLFIETQNLEPEQYRVVTDKSQQSYEYPSLPVPYEQRKRMSNAIFAMSKTIPGLTDECAAVLSEGRKQDAWDFMVAELMTQVVVLTQCSENDEKLDGLSQYLLTLGIAC